MICLYCEYELQHNIELDVDECPNCQGVFAVERVRYCEPNWHEIRDTATKASELAIEIAAFLDQAAIPAIRNCYVYFNELAEWADERIDR